MTNEERIKLFVFYHENINSSYVKETSCSLIYRNECETESLKLLTKNTELYWDLVGKAKLIQSNEKYLHDIDRTINETWRFFVIAIIKEKLILGNFQKGDYLKISNFMESVKDFSLWRFDMRLDGAIDYLERYFDNPKYPPYKVITIFENYINNFEFFNDRFGTNFQYPELHKK